MLSLALACSSAPKTQETPPAPTPEPPAATIDLSGSPEELCQRLSTLHPPAQDLPSDPERATLQGCDAEALYYGIGQPKDPAAARKCAFIEREKPDAPIFGGDAILMMIYANGLEVPRNEPLAISLACAIGGAQAEIESRVEHLVQRSRDPNAAADLDLCDDITSGFMMGACSAHSQRMSAPAADDRERAVFDKVPPEAKPQLDALRQAADAFFQARVENEVDLSGTARAAMQIEEETSLRTGFIAAIERAVDPSSALPAAERDLKAADKALNIAYQKIVSQGESFSYGTVTLDGVRTTERAWLAYRDAWAAFGAKARQGSTPDAWSAWATAERAQQLEALAP